jgi:pyrroloquinoline-quinone synthase
MTRVEFRNALLEIMEAKSHWADFAFPAHVSNGAMLTRFQREYWDFVKPFPYYLRGVLAQLPKPKKGKEDAFADVRKDLIENIEEEETGMHHAGESHAELFLRIPKDPAFGFQDSDFRSPPNASQSVAYRSFLTNASYNRGWEVGAAVTTLFLEGNKHERSNFHKEFGIQPWRGLPLEEHPLRVHKGVALESLKLVEVHHTLDAADGDHRRAAWNMMLKHISPAKRREVVSVMQEALTHYQAWRDEEAELCGVKKPTENRET